MNKLSLTVSASLVFCSLSYAGSERLSGKEMKQVAPLPPPCPNWTDFYVGVIGGYKFGAIDTDLSLGGGWNFHPEGRNVVEAHSPELDTSGAELGGLIGYNYQFTNRWVVGLEAAGGYLWLRDSDGTGIFHTRSTGDFDITTSFKTLTWLRLGRG